MGYFFPDRIFVEQDGRYGAVPYESLSVECFASRFIEDGVVPRDAQVVGHTWKYVRRDGGPDRRFSNNRQLPIASYAHVEIRSQSGLNLHLQLSSIPFAEAFSQPFRRTGTQSSQRQNPRGSGSGPSSGSSRRKSTSAEPHASIRSPYEILGVTNTATSAEISAAYKRMAQMYHPDKVATMALEFRELAERRMKEINTAYEALKQGNAPP